MKRSSGFTLMELMVTMGILAVLAAIAIPSYKSYMHNSYLTECQNEVAAIQLAEQEFFLENNQYFPAPGTAVSSDVTTPQITAIENASNGMYVSGYTVANNLAQTQANLLNANCLYTVSTTATGDSYTIAVTGRNNLDANDNFSKTK